MQQVGGWLFKIVPRVVPLVKTHGDEWDFVQPPFDAFQVNLPEFFVDGEQRAHPPQKTGRSFSHIFFVCPCADFFC